MIAVILRFIAVKPPRAWRSGGINVQVPVPVVIAGSRAGMPKALVGDHQRVDPGEAAVAIVLIISRRTGNVVGGVAVDVAVIIEIAPDICQGAAAFADDVADLQRRHLDVGAVIIAVEAIGSGAVIGQISVEITVVIIIDPVPHLAVDQIAGDDPLGDAVQGSAAVLAQAVLVQTVHRRGAAGRAAADKQVDVAIEVVIGPGGNGIGRQLGGEFEGVDLRQSSALVVVEQAGDRYPPGNESPGGMGDDQVDEAIIVEIRPGCCPAAIGKAVADIAGGHLRKAAVAVVDIQERIRPGDITIDVAIIVEIRPALAVTVAAADLPAAQAAVGDLGKLPAPFIAVEQVVVDEQVDVAITVVIHPAAADISSR